MLGKRADGLHEICTVFQTVSLCDYLTFETADEIRLTCDAANVPTDASNLIWRAADLLRAKFAFTGGARIHLQKRIPSPGGLGGGSSDAAIALLALSHLWQLPVTKAGLHEIAARLGADVPFFLTGGTMRGTGLGTTLESWPDAPPIFLLIVTPDENVLTAAAYQSLNAPRLTEAGGNDNLTICRFENSLEFLTTELQNDFEKTIFELKPEIARVKQSLLDAKAINALMSGSGASVFGIFDNQDEQTAAFEMLRRREKSWRVFACQTISQADYRVALQPIKIID